MTNIKNDKDLKEKLNKHITLPEHVEGKMNEAYQQIRVRSSMENSKVVAYQKLKFRRWMTVAATFTLMIATTVGVLAANGFFSREIVKNEDSTTYKFDIDYELKPGKFELTPGYIPAGYYEREEGKYWPDNDEHSGITVAVNSTTDIEKLNEKLQSSRQLLETTTIGNSEADILVDDKTEPDKGMKEIYIFNSEEGYVAWVWGDNGTPLADVKKFAEELVVTRIADGVYETAEEKTERQNREQEEQAAMEGWMEQEEAIREAGISESDLFAIGQEGIKEIEYEDGILTKTVGYTIESAEFVDNIKDYDPANFYNYEEVSPWLNEDGSLKPYLRIEDTVGDGKASSFTDAVMVNQSLLKVIVKAKRYNEENVYAPEDELMTPLDGRLIHLEKKTDGNYTWGSTHSMPAEGQNYNLKYDEMPIYIDSPQFTEGDKRTHSFFYRDLAVGEEIEYTLVFVVDEDQKDSLALDFNGFSSMEIEKPVWFKIK